MNDDSYLTARKVLLYVIPAKAGIQVFSGAGSIPVFPEMGYFFFRRCTSASAKLFADRLSGVARHFQVPSAAHRPPRAGSLHFDSTFPIGDTGGSLSP